MEQPLVRVGIGVFIFKDGQFLMGQRKGSHGADRWSIPGGHMDYGESFADTAAREVLEETGVKIKDICFGAVTNDLFPEDKKHYVTVWMLSDYESGEPTITEPDKYVDQVWKDFDSLPRPLFQSCDQLLASEFIDEIKRQSKLSK